MYYWVNADFIRLTKNYLHHHLKSDFFPALVWEMSKIVSETRAQNSQASFTHSTIVILHQSKDGFWTVKLMFLNQIFEPLSHYSSNFIRKCLIVTWEKTSENKVIRKLFTNVIYIFTNNIYKMINGEECSEITKEWWWYQKYTRLKNMIGS